jgi:small conductance mechanosensitive channel
MENMFGNTEAMMSEWGPILLGYALDILGALVILIVGWIVANWLSKKVYAAVGKTGKIEDTIARFVRQMVKILVIIVTLLAVLGQFGIETTSIIAVLGAATLAIGLALQGTLSNVAAGVMLLIFRPFKVGDAVSVAGNVGAVEEIGIFTTIMKTFDGIHVNVPNGKIWGSEVTNFSINPTRRHNMVFGIGYGDDMDKAVEIIRGILEADERVLKDPAPVVEVDELADSSVNIIARPWTVSSDFWGVKWDTIKKVKKEFDAQGISIPFPQRDVHLHQAEK